MVLYNIQHKSRADLLGLWRRVGVEAVGVLSPILYNSLFLLSVNKRGFSLFPPTALLIFDNAIIEFTVCWSELTSRMV